MKLDGSKHSSFSVQNNQGGAKILSERIVPALNALQQEAVVIGMEAKSIYGNNLAAKGRSEAGSKAYRIRRTGLA